MMNSATLRTLAALAVTLAAAGCADTPTGATTAADAPVLSTGSPLAVSIGNCSAYGCMATASGGTGTGYSFTWVNTWAGNEGDNWSHAYPRCPTGYGIPVYINVGVTVTDSGGATTTRYAEVYCPRYFEPVH